MYDTNNNNTLNSNESQAGRLTAYVVEKGDEREDDGSCSCTSTCGYIPVADGGTGKNIVKGLFVYPSVRLCQSVRAYVYAC